MHVCSCSATESRGGVQTVLLVVPRSVVQPTCVVTGERAQSFAMPTLQLRQTPHQCTHSWHNTHDYWWPDEPLAPRRAVAAYLSRHDQSASGNSRAGMARSSWSPADSRERAAEAAGDSVLRSGGRGGLPPDPGAATDTPACGVAVAVSPCAAAGAPRERRRERDPSSRPVAVGAGTC